METMDLERENLRAIRRELPNPLDPAYEDIILRVICATGDLSYAQILRFSPGIVPLVRTLLAGGASIVADTPMVLAGIDPGPCERLGIQKIGLIDDWRAGFQPCGHSVSWAQGRVERVLGLPGPKIVVCGSAPAFLLPIVARRPADVPIIGVPAGFVHADQAKNALWSSGLPCIVTLGRRGGGTVAAALVNALLCGVPGVRSAS